MTKNWKKEKLTDRNMIRAARQEVVFHAEVLRRASAVVLV